MKGRCISFTNEEITAMDKFVACFNENYDSDEYWPPKKKRPDTK